MTVLLGRYRGHIQITPEVVAAAAGNWQSGEGVIRVILLVRYAA